jgi:chromate reductase, NAD(P)H dehydrogenase (quinone)
LKILAICGSTRTESINLVLLQIIKKMIGDKAEFEIFEGLAELPHFNPDLDGESPPAEVVKLRQKIVEANAVIICTPEYVFTLPGSLKNALEWTVSTQVFAAKPCALITASALGQKAHESLLLVMKTIEAKTPAALQLLISHARQKIGVGGEILDPTTKSQVVALVEHLIDALLVKPAAH